MAGFGIDKYHGRVPCPYCGSTDCCGMKNRDTLICCKTQKTVSYNQLLKSAKNNNLKPRTQQEIKTYHTT